MRAHNQRATPPWCEQVPRRCALKEKLPSRQRADAPTGVAPVSLCAGECTTAPSTLR
jgi:hypothetical protein